MNMPADALDLLTEAIDRVRHFETMLKESAYDRIPPSPKGASTDVLKSLVRFVRSMRFRWCKMNPFEYESDLLVKSGKHFVVFSPSDQNKRRPIHELQIPVELGKFLVGFDTDLDRTNEQDLFHDKNIVAFAQSTERVYWTNVCQSSLKELEQFADKLRIHAELKRTGSLHLPVLVVRPRLREIEINGIRETYGERAVQAATYVIEEQKRCLRNHRKPMFDRKELCQHLKVGAGPYQKSIIRDCFRNTPLSGLCSSVAGEKNKFVLKIDCQRSTVEA